MNSSASTTASTHPPDFFIIGAGPGSLSFLATLLTSSSPSPLTITLLCPTSTSEDGTYPKSLKDWPTAAFLYPKNIQALTSNLSSNRLTGPRLIAVPKIRQSAPERTGANGGFLFTYVQEQIRRKSGSSLSH